MKVINFLLGFSLTINIVLIIGIGIAIKVYFLFNKKKDPTNSKTEAEQFFEGAVVDKQQANSFFFDK